MSFFDTVKETALNVGSATAEKTKELAEITKLKNAIATEERKIKDQYIAIGKLYTQTYGDSPEAIFADSIQAIKQSEQIIEEKKVALDNVKNNPND